jgi:riboflavin synthase
MFTGIVAAVGRITQIAPLPKGMRLTIDTAGLPLADAQLGDSICVNGVCLTAVALSAHGFEADVSRETLDCTVGLDQLAEVNLEKSLTLADRLGGHLVSGHVDGVGDVLRFEAIGESWFLEIEAPHAIARYIARKGSVTVNGTSLTVNHVDGRRFDINIIPHTHAVTTFRNLQPGHRVNLEVDLIARYCERILSYDRGTDA